jgi:hypothetical protein
MVIPPSDEPEMIALSTPVAVSEPPGFVLFHSVNAVLAA